MMSPSDLMTTKTMTFQACVSFEIPIMHAVRLLADPSPSKAIGDWIDGHHYAIVQGSGAHNQSNLKGFVESALLEAAIDETKLLTVSCDPQMPTQRPTIVLGSVVGHFDRETV